MKQKIIVDDTGYFEAEQKNLEIKSLAKIQKINIEYKDQVVHSFPTSNEEIKAVCTPVDQDTMKITIVDLLIFRAKKEITKEAKKETYYPYIKARNKVMKIK